MLALESLLSLTSIPAAITKTAGEGKEYVVGGGERSKICHSLASLSPISSLSFPNPMLL